MKRILLTGANGFLGRPCLSQLIANAAEDEQIHAVQRPGLEPRDRILGPVAKSSQVVVHEADLLHPDESQSLLSRVAPTHLLHLAWTTKPGDYWTSVDNVRWLEASLRLLRSFADCGGRRLVVAGSCAEYEWTGEVCSEETTRRRPATLYGAAKNALFETANHYCEQTDISFAWGRLFFLYGPRQHPQRLVPSVVAALLNNEIARCSSGCQQRDFLYVEDAASALVRLLRGNVRGPVNIASGEAVAIKTVVEQIAHVLQKRSLLRMGALADNEGEPECLMADVSRLRQALNWSPRSLSDGLTDTINWWRNCLDERRVAS